MSPEVRAYLAQIHFANTEQVATGELCRCPEHVLDCVCGAYENVEAN